MSQTKIIIKNNIRIFLSDFQELSQQIIDYHDYLPLPNLILTNAISAFAPLRFLYNSKKILVKIKTNGAMQMLLVEIQNQSLRALIANGQIATEYDKKNFNKIPLILGIGDHGRLHVGRIVNNETFSSEVDLVKADLVTDLAYYLNQSDQTFSAIVNDVALNEENPQKVFKAKNVLFQLLPDYTEADVIWIENFIKDYPLKNYSLEEYEKLIAGNYLETQTINGSCWCSKVKLINAINLLNYEEKKSLFSQDNQTIESICDFCNQKYLIKQEDLK